MIPISTIPTKGSVNYCCSENIDLEVNYKNSLQKMINSCGCERNTRLISEDRVKITPLSFGKYSQVKLFSFFRSLSTNQIIGLIEDDCKEFIWQPARIEHLLAFGAHSPREQLNGPIIALGTPITLSDGINFPWLCYLHNERTLSVNNNPDLWQNTYRFLAFR